MAFNFLKLSSLFRGDISMSQGKTIIGVDIGSSAIKIVELRDNKGVPTLNTYGELQLGPYEGVEIGMTARPSVVKLTEAFVDIMREASATSNHIALSIPYSASFTTIIGVPTVDMSKIASIIPVEARKYVPVPLNEISLDWFPVSNGSEKHETKVLLSAIYNDALKRYEGIIKGANLSMQFTEIEVFSTIRSVVSQRDETVAVIDLGAGSTKLYIVHTGFVGKTYNVLMSGSEITRTLAKMLGIGFNAAEVMKRSTAIGGTPSGNNRAQKILVDAFDRGFREIHHVIKRYEEEEGYTVQKIILTGNGALLANLPSYAHDLFALPIEIADPFSKVAYPAFLEDTLRDAGPSFAVAIGTALRGLMVL